MTTFDLRLVNKGAREPLGALQAQARVSHGLWEDHAATLEAWGFSPAAGQRLGELANLLDSGQSRSADAKGGARNHTRTESAARTQAKTLFRRFRTVLPTVLRKNPGLGVTAEEFNAGGPLGDSTPRILAYVNKIMGPAKKVDAAMAPYLQGQKLSELLEGVRTSLSTADTAQELAVAGLPAETQSVYQLKGEALDLVEELNAVGKNAFEGNAAVRAQFNKDILLRGRKKAEGPGPGPG